MNVHSNDNDIDYADNNKNYHDNDDDDGDDGDDYGGDDAYGDDDQGSRIFVVVDAILNFKSLIGCRSAYYNILIDY